MHGRMEGWLVGILAVVIFCAGSAGAWSQDQWYVPADPTELDAQMISVPMTVATSRLVSYADEPSLVDMEARIAGLEIAAAAAKKKAASKPSLKAGGRIMVDFATFDQNAASVAQNGGVDWENGTEFRRARMFLSGEAFQVIDYKIQMDFADQVDFKDVYVAVKELPLLGHVKVGHFKEPWSLEELTSSKYITFMERSNPNVIGSVGGRKTGIMAYDNNEAETMTWAIGIFTANGEGENPPGLQNDAGNNAVTMRVTYLPWYDEATEGRGVFHTGIAYSYRELPQAGAGNPIRFRQRPEAHMAGRVVDTGNLFDVDKIDAFCAEAAFVYGPFSVQAEYFGYEVDRTAAADPYFDGGYVYISYFLTGEHRKYKRTAGTFDRVKPFENFFRVRGEDGNVYTGKGAWEVGYRWSRVDLNDNGTVGGRATDHTFGVNWYLNPYTRVMFNYVNTETRNHPIAGGIGRANIFETRVQIDF